MTRKVRIGSLALLCAAALAPVLAFAHGGHAQAAGAGGFALGFNHPFSGLDHILVMAAVGIWAVRIGSRARWGVPAVLAGAMAAAGLFSVFHAMAYGHGLSYAGGVLASTVILNISGAGAGLALRRFERYFLARHAGPVTAAVGAILFFV